MNVGPRLLHRPQAEEDAVVLAGNDVDEPVQALLAVERLGDSPVAGRRRIIGMTGHVDAGFGRHRDAVFLESGVIRSHN